MFSKLIAQLAKHHNAKLQEIETEKQIILEERRKAFEEAFEADMQHYKIHGQIESKQIFCLKKNPSNLIKFKLISETRC